MSTVLETIFNPEQIAGMMRASEALEMANDPPVQERLFKVLTLIHVVAANGKKRALVALHDDEDPTVTWDCLLELGYDVKRSYDNKNCIEVSWQHAQTSDKADAKTA